jgi:hypothetical protein
MSKIFTPAVKENRHRLRKRRHLTALVIFSIAHRFIDLRHVGVSVDRVSHKNTSAS